MYNKKSIKNGLTLITSPMDHMESVSIGVWVRMGGRYEKKQMCGVSHFIEHMLFKGTHKRNAKQLKRSIEGIGGHFNGFTGEEVTCYLVKVPSAHTDMGIDILSDMVLNPVMHLSDMERERQVICEEIKMYKDQPSSYVHELLSDLMWPDHPLGRPLAGYEASVKMMTRENLLSVMKKSYKPSSIAVVATGKINEKKFINSVEKCFRVPKVSGKLNYEMFADSQTKTNLKIVHKDTEQTHIAVGFHSFGRQHKDKYVLSLLNIIIGGNMSSRLFEELREKRGLCYEASSLIKKYDETGAFVIHCGIDNTKVKETIEAIMVQLKLLKTKPVGTNELKRAKEFYKGQILLALEDTGSRMLWLGDKVMTNQGIPDISGLLSAVDKITVDDIFRTADSVFRQDKLNLAAIGPSSSLKTEDIEEKTVV